MGVPKRQRLDEFYKRLKAIAPFADRSAAQFAIEATMRAVENEMSGIPENLKADSTLATDGRMYPPSEKFAIPSSSARVVNYKQFRHRTSIGDNGAILISGPNGEVELDIPGRDGQSVNDLLGG